MCVCVCVCEGCSISCLSGEGKIPNSESDPGSLARVISSISSVLTSAYLNLYLIVLFL